MYADYSAVLSIVHFLRGYVNLIAPHLSSAAKGG